MTRLLVSQPGRTFAKGDRILVGAPVGPADAPEALWPYEIVVIDSVDTWHGRALLTLEGPITKTGGYGSLVAHKLASTFHHFGHNAPRQLVTVDSSGHGTGVDVGLARDFSQAHYSGGENAGAYPTLDQTEIPLIRRRTISRSAPRPRSR